jgi:hypothetical protein
MFTEPWEMRGGSLELVQDAVICIFFTLCSAALLLNNALAQRDPSMLSSMSHNGGPNIYVVYGRNSGFSSAWTALFVTAVVNAILFAVSTVMLAVWLVSGPSACNTKHTFVGEFMSCQAPLVNWKRAPAAMQLYDLLCIDTAQQLAACWHAMHRKIPTLSVSCRASCCKFNQWTPST